MPDSKESRIREFCGFGGADWDAVGEFIHGWLCGDMVTGERSGSIIIIIDASRVCQFGDWSTYCGTPYIVVQLVCVDSIDLHVL